MSENWSRPYDVLRGKWSTVPAGPGFRFDTKELLRVPDGELLSIWDASFRRASLDEGYSIRGWYHDLYRDQLKGLDVLDIGCGFGLSSLYFAEHGARVTFTDIVEENVEVVKRLCRIRRIDAEFLVIDDEHAFRQLATQYDAVLALGSLINAPREVIRDEIQAILPHLKVGGRWLHFAYPKARWIREGMKDFAEWGEHTDGPGTPWMEYHDRETLDYLFSPATIRIVFDCEWHNNDFVWYDCRLVAQGR